MNVQELISIYAELVVKAGVNLRPGQCLLINTGVGTYEFARAVAEAAYKTGAKFVRINIIDNHLTRYRLNYGRKEDLEWVPNYMINESYEFLAQDWARIRIDNTEELEVLKDADPAALGTLLSVQGNALKRQKEQLMRDQHSWTVIAAPGPRWARYVLKNSGLKHEADTLSDDEAEKKLWDYLIPILRLKADNPVETWRQHRVKLAARCEVLNAFHLEKLRFTNSDTDLEVALCSESIWRGGGGTLPDGRAFLANLPTEEVYTTPDYRKTKGYVKVCRPVNVLENLVEGAWFEFDKGRVINCGATKGDEVLKKFVSLDDGASFLGEVALVAGDSPIFQSGLLFGSILYDENASCHIALGAAYPSCLSNASSLGTTQALKDAGCNVSIVHTDFMIGTPKTDVTGIGFDGKTHTIIQQGNFVL